MRASESKPGITIPRPSRFVTVSRLVSFIPGRHITSMARTNAKKRQAELASARERQARRRERLRAAGKPDTADVDRALVEALAFALHKQLSGMTFRGTDEEIAHALASAAAQVAVPVSTLVTTAVGILVKREGKDRAATREAVKRRIARRREHRDPSYYPSLNPDPVAQAARIADAKSVTLTDTTVSDRA